MITSKFYFIYLPWVQFLRAYPGLPADPVYPEERKLKYVLRAVHSGGAGGGGSCPRQEN